MKNDMSDAEAVKTETVQLTDAEGTVSASGELPVSRFKIVSADFESELVSVQQLINNDGNETNAALLIDCEGSDTDFQALVELSDTQATEIGSALIAAASD
jgi:hypothetical protein